MMKEIKEEWRPVRGFEELYEVSNFGEVKSLNYNNTGKAKMLTPSEDGDGYFRVGLSKNGKLKNLRVHRLMGIAFLPIPEHLKDVPIEKLDVEHIDADNKNNRLENLRWTDRKGNMNNPITKQRMSDSRKGEKNWIYGKHHSDESRRKMSDSHMKKPVLQINKDTGEIIREFPSIREAERAIGRDHTHISKCCLGKQQTCGGFIWRYAEK